MSSPSTPLRAGGGTGSFTYASDLRAILSRDRERMRILGLVLSLRLPDCWIGAGFVRNAVWDHMHGRQPSAPDSDVDVVWFDPHRADPAEDVVLRERLKALDRDIAWSVKNQSRMHVRNDDEPYASTSDALRFWPETATAVAVRLSGHPDRPLSPSTPGFPSARLASWRARNKSRIPAGPGDIEIAAPFGLDDLFGLIVRPGPRFREAKRDIFHDRVRTKQWLRIWPRLTLMDAA